MILGVECRQVILSKFNEAHDFRVLSQRILNAQLFDINNIYTVMLPLYKAREPLDVVGYRVKGTVCVDICGK